MHFLTPEHVCTIHCDLSYRGLVSGGGAEASNATLAEIMVAFRSRYTRDNRRARSIGDGGGDRDGGIGGIEIVGYVRTEGGRIK